MRRGHVIALAGALALLLITAMDWYGTATGDEARRIENATEEPSGAEGGEIDRRLNEDARFVAEREEKNAWQAADLLDWERDTLVDKILMVLLLAAIVFAVLTAITRASGAKPTKKGLGPAGATALIAAGAAILVAYRIIQEPGLDAGTNVKAGAPLALLALGMIGLGASSALRADDREEEAADAGAD